MAGQRRITLLLAAALLWPACCPRVMRVPDPPAHVVRGALANVPDPHEDTRIDPARDHRGMAIDPVLNLLEAQPELIARTRLLGHQGPDHVTLSPDGRSLAWVAHGSGPSVVRISDASPGAVSRVVRKLADNEQVTGLSWTYEASPRLLARFATAPDDAQKVKLVLLAGASQPERELAVEGSPAVGAHLGPLAPDRILVGAAAPGGGHSWVQQPLDGPLQTQGMAATITPPGFTPVPSPDLGIPFALSTADTGELVLWRASGSDASGFVEVTRILAVDAAPFRVLWAAPDGDHLVALDRSGRHRVALVKLSGHKGSRTLLAEDEQVDVHTALVDPRTGAAVSVTSSRPSRRWRPVSKEAEVVAATLSDQEFGRPEGLARAQDGTRWLLARHRTDGPSRFELWTIGAGTTPLGEGSAPPATRLATPHEDLAIVPLSHTQDIQLPARDGLALRGRLTLPASERGVSRPVTPRPTVLLFGADPWQPAEGVWSPSHEWLADRGYAVLEIDLRGTRGYGRSVEAAGRGEWSWRLHGDIPLIVDWAIREGIADADRICSLGYGWAGGYSALVGLTGRAEGRFRCVAAVAPAADLVALRPRLSPRDRDIFEALVGDDDAARSASLPVAQLPGSGIGALLVTGRTDRTVPASRVADLSSALRARNVKAVLATVPGDTQDPRARETQLAIATLVEHWLARHLDRYAERPRTSSMHDVTVDDEGEATWLPLPMSTPGGH